MCPKKKDQKCAIGGYAELQKKILAGEEIECQACLWQLERKKFKPEGLQKVIDDVLAGLRSPKPADQPVRSEDGAAEPVDDDFEEPLPKKPTPEPTSNVPNIEDMSPEEVMELFKPVIELLPAGTSGKRNPYRCLACRTRHQPSGKVGELGRWQSKSIYHFLSQHCDGATHQKKLKVMMNVEKADAPEMVQCQAISTKCSDTGGKLYLHRAEVDLWARMSDLEQHAQHSYQYCANEGAWIVRSKRCDKEIERVDELDRQVCAPCLALGAVHSEPRPVLDVVWVSIFHVHLT